MFVTTNLNVLFKKNIDIKKILSRMIYPAFLIFEMHKVFIK